MDDLDIIKRELAAGEEGEDDDQHEPAYPVGDDWNPTEALIRGLLASQAGEPYSQDEMQDAAMVLACAALMSRGVDEATAMRAVEQASENGTIKIRYSAEEGLDVSIERGEEA